MRKAKEVVSFSSDTRNGYTDDTRNPHDGRRRFSGSDVKVMGRTVRYQGAVIRDGQVLLIKHREHATGRSYWVIPGGGCEDDETEEACVQREMLEETHLRVTVERLLFDDAGVPGGVYRRLKTYLCRAAPGDARPGQEPEEEAAAEYAIDEVGWFDLRDPDAWDAQVRTDPFTYPLLLRIQAALGYPVGSTTSRE